MDSELPIRLLYWSDCGVERQTVHAVLATSRVSFELSDCDSQQALEAYLQASVIDVLVVDFGEQGERFEAALPWARRLALPLVLLADPEQEVAALAALERGGTDYVLKTTTQLGRLPAAIALAVQSVKYKTSHVPDFGRSPLWQLVHDAVYTTDAMDRITGWNRAAEKLYGWARQEVLGKNLLGLLLDRTANPSAVEVITQPTAAHLSRTMTTHHARDGRPLAVEVASTPLFDSSGELVGRLTAVRDVTDRNSALQKAWDNEARLQLTCRAAGEAIADYDLRSGRVWRSEGFLRLFGYDPVKIPPTVGWWIKRIHPDDLDRVWKMTSRIAEDGDTTVFEYRFIRADGTFAYVLHRGCILRDANGIPVRITTTMVDVTAQKRNLQALSESERRYRLLAENSTDVILRVDDDGVIRYASPAVRTVLGYCPEDVQGSVIYDYVHEDDRASLFESLTSGTRDALTVVCRVRTNRNDYVWLESVFRTLLDARAESTGEVVCISRDVTLRRQAEDLIRIQQAELAHISRLTSMGEMASGIAHELNQPLAAISHYADACRESIRGQPMPADKLLAWTNKIADQAERAGDIIRRIKGFVQKTQPERREVDAHHLLREVMELLDPDAKLYDIQLELEDHEPLPPLHVDKVQIQQVLVNLLRNAFEALDETQSLRRVIVRATSPAPSEVLVSVVDGGIGIAPVQLERIFEPFYSTKPDGTGVGLAISRSIVEDHGGQLWATSNLDQGTTFWFTLPTAYRKLANDNQSRGLRGGRRFRPPRSAAVDLGNDGP